MYQQKTTFLGGGFAARCSRQVWVALQEAARLLASGTQLLGTQAAWWRGPLGHECGVTGRGCPRGCSSSLGMQFCSSSVARHHNIHVAWPCCYSESIESYGEGGGGGDLLLPQSNSCCPGQPRHVTPFLHVPGSQWSQPAGTQSFLCQRSCSFNSFLPLRYFPAACPSPSSSHLLYQRTGTAPSSWLNIAPTLWK